MEVQKTSNKENARPKRAEQKQVVTSFIKRPAPGKSAPLRSKNDPKDGAVEKRAEPLKKATEQQKSSVAKPPLASKKPASLSQKFLSQQTSTYKKMQTQTPKPASVAPPKAVSSVAPKPTLGTYKGKVVQSKVDCFRKPEDPATKAAEKRVFARPAVPMYTPLTPATLSRIKSRSVTTLASAKPASSTVSQTQPRRPKSVTDVPLSRPASRTTTTRGQPQTVSTTRQFQVTKRPPVTTTNRPVAPAMAGTKGVAAATTRLAKSKSTTELNQRAANPPAPAPSSTLRPPPRKPAVSTLGHTRATMETAEERRAKLAEWLATKGKTLKRPPIHASSSTTTTTTTQPPAQRSKPAATKPRAAASTAPAQKKAQPATAPEVTHQAPEPEPVVELTAPQPQSWEEQEEEEAAGSSGPVTSSPSPAAAAPAPGMNTTLDMLDSCALDLPEVDVEVPMHELVVNLCEALEAMEPPSTCQSNDEKEDASEQEAAEEGAEMQVEQEEVVEEEEKIEEEEEEKVEVEEGEIKVEMADEKNESLASSTEASAEDSESGMDADSIEESESESDSLSGEDDQPDTADVTERKVKTEVKQEEEEEEEDDYDDEDEKENCGPTTPECNGASVVKFSVRTTPFLQSVKKRIDDGACASPCASASAMVAPASCPPARSRKSATAIGELKFLTPVRRSRRIERQSARLPAALADHDPCVTSLAELARLEGGEDGVDGHGGAMMAANAYIYRRNPALLNDTHTDLTRL